MYGQSVTLNATVTAQGITPTGTVSFMNGGTVLGNANLSAGAASLKLRLYLSAWIH